MNKIRSVPLASNSQLSIRHSKYSSKCKNGVKDGRLSYIIFARPFSLSILFDSVPKTTYFHQFFEKHKLPPMKLHESYVLLVLSLELSVVFGCGGSQSGDQVVHVYTRWRWLSKLGVVTDIIFRFFMIRVTLEVALFV